MIKMGAKRFKPGDKVRVITWNGRRPKTWNSEGLMDSWQGKIVTIKEASPYYSQYKIEEDQHTPGRRNGWFWYDSDFESIGFFRLDDSLFDI